MKERKVDSIQLKYEITVTCTDDSLSGTYISLVQLKDKVRKMKPLVTGVCIDPELAARPDDFDVQPTWELTAIKFGGDDHFTPIKHRSRKTGVVDYEDAF